MNPGPEPRNILVTGATGRIGGAVARRLAQDGFRVTVHCRSREAEARALCADLEATFGDRVAPAQERGLTFLYQMMEGRFLELRTGS